MKKYVMKAVVFTLLTALIFGSFAAASIDEKSPNIESVEPWPEDVNHGEEVYVDAEITDQSSVDKAWLVVRSEGERVRSGALVDSNKDGYYVSPVAFTADGGKDYELIVKVVDEEGNQFSEKVEVEADCGFKILSKCLF